MILDVEEEWVDWVWAGGVFATLVALSHDSIFVFVLFVVAVVEVERPELTRIVGHDVFVVNDTVLLREESVRERSVLIIANTRLAKVDHSSVNASVDQLHRG